MAQTGYTPIQLYYSTTPAQVPSGANLASGELAINIADGKLYFKNSSNVVTLLADSASSGDNITVGTTTVTGGTSGYVLYNNAGVLGNLTNTGTGNNVLATSPTLVTPLLGTPTSGTLTNCTGYTTANLSGSISLTTQVSGTLPIGNGGTNATTKSGAFDSLSPMTTGGDIIYGGLSGTGTRLGIGSTGQVLTVSGGIPAWTTLSTGSGTVTSVSVVSANGFAGSVATSTTTPAITLTTSITGVLKGNGTAISAATAGTDYVVGGTTTVGRLIAQASTNTALGASLGLTSGVAPSTAVSGDMWNESGVPKFFNGSATKTLAFTDSNITGTAAGLSATLAVGSGGTGRTTNTAYAVICGGTTNGGAEQSIASVGNSGDVLTSNGAGALPTFQAAGGGFAAGTVMLFAQTSAPTGWTKDTTLYNNSALRVVTGAASSGGTVDFTTAFASQTPTGSVTITSVSGSAGATTLTTPQIPSHSHGNTFISGPYPPGQPRIGGGCPFSAGNAQANAVSTGGGGSHTHPFAFTSGAGSFTGNAIDLSVKYVDVIRATKN